MTQKLQSIICNKKILKGNKKKFLHPLNPIENEKTIRGRKYRTLSTLCDKL